MKLILLAPIFTFIRRKLMLGNFKLPCLIVKSNTKTPTDIMDSGVYLTSKKPN